MVGAGRKCCGAPLGVVAVPITACLLTLLD